VDTVKHCRALRSASLQQAAALRAAIPRQTSTDVAALMRGEAERLEAVADECRARIALLQPLVDA